MNDSVAQSLPMLADKLARLGRNRPRLSPLSLETFREFPPCRTLAYYRRNLGNGEDRLALRWTDLNRSPHWERLSQTRLAILSILVSLSSSISAEDLDTLAYWVITQAPKKVGALGDATNISSLENGRHPINEELRSVLLNVCALTAWPCLSTGRQIFDFRSRFGLSQTRFVAVCLLSQTPLPDNKKREFINAIIARQYYCPSAGDCGHISQIECGGKQVSRDAMAAFCRTFSYLLARTITPEELFDDFLEEMNIGYN